MNIKELAHKYENMKNRMQKHSTLQITDNCEIIADGCRKIVSCDENIVIIDLALNRATITGESLKLRNWGTDGVTISGAVKSVEFEVPPC
jgi:hypothetical protein